MKTRYINFLSVGILALLIFVTGCKSKEWVESRGTGPTMTIGSEFEKIDGINVGDQVSIPVNIKSSVGIKRFSYYFITETANGTRSETPVHVDRTDFPTELNESLTFNIVPAIVELVLVSFDKNNNSSELHIKLSDIRELPVLVFKDGTDSISTYFENKRISVEGNVTSEYDLSSITYRTVENGIVSSENPISFTDKRNTPFAANVVVEKGLTAIIITAKNIHNGIAVDTFRIGTVTDDAITISLAGNATQIPVVYADSANTINASVVSGSDASDLTYAIKANGVYGNEQTVQLGSPKDNFTFDINFTGVPGMEAIRITGSNEGGKTNVVEIPVASVSERLIYFRGVQLTTEIGPGKKNWFAAYQPPHTFDVASAAPLSHMMDLLFFKNSATTYRFGPASLVMPGTGYEARLAPYTAGFSNLPFLLVPSTRSQVTPASFSSVNWDHELGTFIDDVIVPTYNVYTQTRRVSDNVTRAGQGYVLAWGDYTNGAATANNTGFALLITTGLTVANGEATVTFDIKVPAKNYRALYPTTH